jgi:hypothetical protein
VDGVNGFKSLLSKSSAVDKLLFKTPIQLTVMTRQLLYYSTVLTLTFYAEQRFKGL